VRSLLLKIRCFIGEMPLARKVIRAHFDGLISKIRIDQEKQRAWKQFEIIRVDALMVCDELRSRLSPLVHEKVVTNTPTFRSSDEPKAEFSVARLLATVSIEGVDMLAGEIEHLSKLQLAKLETCAC
jgi:hypothetical protein